MCVVQMNDINPMPSDKGTDVPPAVPDMKAFISVISRNQPIEDPHKAGTVDHMNSLWQL